MSQSYKTTKGLEGLENTLNQPLINRTLVYNKEQIDIKTINESWWFFVVNRIPQKSISKTH